MEGDFINQKFYKFLFLFHKEQPILNMLLRPVVKIQLGIVFQVHFEEVHCGRVHLHL